MSSGVLWLTRKGMIDCVRYSRCANGAWQPSLNISTVLTSIGLVLSEPNPDDGLMCEVSREYKYNRQAFDYKAREMTQKYAVKVNAGDGSSTSLQIQETPNAGEVKSHGDEKVSESGIRVLARFSLCVCGYR
ncbi:hypothetical protein F2Q69_00004266 [Brassica cretica]|uniref:UBC core domain-containing protein n=1 Tax=Brassica cretica TaxID=69181 RepID=A0A8S9NY43_BRACR|nr:hypothetical protein F2Q69_00004266 [Brassica cretica]